MNGNNNTISENTTLSISCVFYDTAYDILEATIESLCTALELSITHGSLCSYTFYLINNSSALNTFQQAVEKATTLMGTKLEVINGHGNIGYGRANNLAIQHTNAEFHLILNPDVKLDKNAIHEGIQFLQENINVGLVAPDAYNEQGEPEYLAKRIPTPFIIFLRGFNINFLNKIFKAQLDNYAYKDKIPTNEPLEIELASGCFMLCRTSILKQVGGFSPEYFLYFEDFDLSKKISKLAALYFLPKIKIIHLGGNAAKKGLKHINLFLFSYLKFLKNFK